MTTTAHHRHACRYLNRQLRELPPCDERQMWTAARQRPHQPIWHAGLALLIGLIAMPVIVIGVSWLVEGLARAIGN